MRWVFLLAGLLSAAVIMSRGGLAAEPPSFVNDFLEEHCLSCHTGKQAKASLDLSQPDKAHWTKVRTQLLRRKMPPEGNERPPASAYRRVLAWMDEHYPAEKPRVTMRRLNRVEYENTIRDLLGVSFDAGENFPADDVGHGFDNIGDVLAMPPILMEKFLAAAEVVAAQAIVGRDPKDPPTVRVEGRHLKREGHGGVIGKGHLLWANGELHATFRFLRSGEYILRARAYGQQAGLDVVRMEFRVAGRTVGKVEVPNTTAATLERRVRVSRGEHRFGMAFVNDFYDPGNPDPKQRDRNAGVVWLEVVGPLDKQVLPDLQARLVKEHGDDLRRHIGDFAALAFRRPVSRDEVSIIKRAVDRAASKKATFEQRLRIAVTAILVSPHFLFRIEPAGDRDLNDFELASRLSYFLWSSMPDETLFSLARKGALRQNIPKQVRRMLRDPRASSLAENFATQWLQISRIDSVTPDPARFPGVTRELLEDMRTETILLFDAVLREDRSLWELLDGEFTFVNERLAKHYGLPGVRGDRMRRVSRKGGVLAHASVLTVTSNPTRTSPVKRGKWILESLLDAPPPPPPPGLDGLKDDGQRVDGLTLRQRFEQHRKDPKCAVCHVTMDALGFGLENYDAVGRWREQDGTLPVDAAGKLPDGRAFDGPAGLRAMLKADPAFLRSLGKHMLTYALGRGVADADEPALIQIVKALQRTPTVRRLVEEIVTLDAFTRR